MEKITGDKTSNAILRRLFRKGELSFAISDLSHAIGPIVDLMFISLFIGTSGVTVMGYVSPLIMILGLIGSCIATGSRIKVSPLLGAGKIDEANVVFSASITLGLAVSIITAIVIGVFCSEVSLILGAKDPLISAMTRQYILGYLIGLPFLSLARLLIPYLQMEGQYGIVSATSMLITIIDIALDAFVVFVLRGGMFEIALATSIGYVIPSYVRAAFFMRRKNPSVFRLSLKGITPAICRDILRLGVPTCALRGSNSAGSVLINNILTALNMRYLVAAYGVFSQITVFVRSAWFAALDTLSSFSGIFIGEEDKALLMETQKISLLHSSLFTCTVAVLLFVFAAPLAGLFLKSNDPEALRIGAECIRVSCFSLPFHTIVYGFSLYLMAVKRLRFCNIYSFMIECGSIVPIMFFMTRIIGYQGAWISKVVNMMILTIIAAFYVYRNGEGKTYRDKMLLLPDSFGIPPEDEISIAASSTDDIIDLSRLAVAFALEHGADRKRAITYGLVTEELAGVLAEHGFSDGKPRNINARLVAKGEELIIRMRDDREPFNFTEYYKIVCDDIEKGAGMSIIIKQSKDIQYTNALGTNNIIVKL